MEATFKITKTFENRNFKNQNEENNLSFKDAVISLEETKKMFVSNSNIILQDTKETLVVLFEDKGTLETIIFNIEKED